MSRPSSWAMEHQIKGMCNSRAKVQKHTDNQERLAMEGKQKTMN